MWEVCERACEVWGVCVRCGGVCERACEVWGVCVRCGGGCVMCGGVCGAHRGLGLVGKRVTR